MNGATHEVGHAHRAAEGRMGWKGQPPPAGPCRMHYRRLYVNAAQNPSYVKTARGVARCSEQRPVYVYIAHRADDRPADVRNTFHTPPRTSTRCPACSSLLAWIFEGFFPSVKDARETCVSLCSSPFWQPKEEDCPHSGRGCPCVLISGCPGIARVPAAGQTVVQAKCAPSSRSIGWDSAGRPSTSTSTRALGSLVSRLPAR